MAQRGTASGAERDSIWRREGSSIWRRGEQLDAEGSSKVQEDVRTLVGEEGTAQETAGPLQPAADSIWT